MLAADGSGTAWSSMSMDTMRMMIKSPDTAAYYKLLDGWKQSYQLLDAHRWQVESYRDALETAWPPDKSRASLEYVTRLNEMVANLKETHKAAVENYGAFADAILSISLARSDFEKIDQEYANNQTALTAFETKMAQDTTTTAKTTPPVADGRQEQLRMQAAARLGSASTDLAQAQIRLVQPTKYELKKLVEDDPTDGTSQAPPVIPPIAATYAENNVNSTGSARSSITFPGGSSRIGNSPLGSPTFTAQPVTSFPGSTQPILNTQQPGLVLGGTGAPVATPPSTGFTPASPSIVGGGPTGPFSSTVIPPGTNSFLPTSGTAASLPRSGIPRAQGVTGGQGLRSAGSIPGGVHASPPGGMIGQPAGRSLGQPGGPRTGRGHINPVGGVIGEGQSQGRPGSRGTSQYGGQNGVSGGRNATSARGTAIGGRGVSAADRAAGSSARGVTESGRAGVPGARGASSGQPYGQSNGRRAAKQAQDESQRWDPNNPWETAEGVDPVLMPPREQRVDPGPAIGLH
ncbi:hypothetical protein ACWKSP_10000 [Micromonosporaceae bacterium Da 78-11]